MSACCITSVLLFYLFVIITITLLSLVMALINVSTGVRQCYTDVLLYIFEWGREKLEFRQDEHNSSAEGSDAEENEEGQKLLKPPDGEIRKKMSGSEIKPPVNIIERDNSTNLWSRLSRKLSVDESGAPLSPGHEHSEGIYELLVRDVMDWTKYGIESIIEDEVTGKFETADLISWNLLFRRKSLKTNQFSKRIWLISCAGWLLRYGILLPTRLILFTTGLLWLMGGSLLVSVAPIGDRGRFWLGRLLTLSCFRIISRSCSLQVNYIGAEKNRPRPGGICVCNHTGPVDGLVVGCDNHFAVVGQLFPGFLGKIQSQMGKLGNTIWFDRTEQKDREAVKRRLAEHVKDLNKPPILLFPEGVTVNNTAILEFRKGAFEASDTIYPVAIRYDQRFGDPFWADVPWYQHMFDLLTCWAIKADCTYLPTMHRQPDESGIDFANRVRLEIAAAGGLTDVNFDGYAKFGRIPVREAEKLKLMYSKRIYNLGEVKDPPTTLLVDKPHEE